MKILRLLYKELVDVFDISHLKIKVGHPNGTEAFISKIGNLKLSNGLIMYDVLVIPEYCVTLIFVHKVAKDNKVFVAFDENKYYVTEKADITFENVFQDLNHINFFDNEYPKIPNDDERVDHNLNSESNSLSDGSYSPMSGGNVDIADFSNGNTEDDAHSSDNIFATQDEHVATLEENNGSWGNLDQCPSSFTHGV
ncbi:hypothetical protein Tco_0963019 [Tanacetum coccineum]